MKREVILITGASSGIGEETAKMLVAQGHVVYAAARRLERMKHLQESGIKTLAMDVTQENSMIEGVETIIQEQGRIDILVNNAGYGSYGAVEDVPLEEAKYQFEVNIFGLARLVQLVLPHMRKQSAGRIVNISSIGGKFGEPHGAWYHGTKFALEGISDSLRMELKQFGIDVVVIQPGAIYTEWNKIARENLIKVSGSTAYGKTAKAHAQMLEKYDKNGSHPKVIAQLISKAVNSRRPKTRYTAGSGAWLALTMRKLLCDRAFDKAFMSMMKAN
ncbi:oxidoreductase [Prolixibacteraceae bacterium JC049]|nr:oxidoreductase [Prolixibacteraceae bacterium JC049]